MKYKVIIKSEVEKQLNKLDNPIKLKILKYIKKNLNNTDNPKKFGKALRYNLKGFWRYRAGDYRVICEIKDDKCIVVVINIGNRREIYDRV